ncbi:Eisosome component PIL1-domain-containing protein [Aspergillus avenaceus]|uniref:Eisosome component PIL1-domain-containing protein n=1 Tax=Aspergillus avenaceus TaxID=36643 RepID=A0A5N6TP07_ASPAV|nr:Eisosome component PIL1-domain-containing protein [Aspergillus avenaceus]
MNRLIKDENAAIGAYEKAGRVRVSVAKELSDWGEATEDEAVSDITDKLGVLLAEVGEQEDLFAAYLEEYRTVLKRIRETEGSVQPSRNHRTKIQDEIAKLKIKDPESMRLETLEQELVRAEAQNLVAEAQLTNMTRSKLKEAFDIHTAAVIERGEKQILLARHARRLLNILDDSPVVPGEPRRDYDRGDEATLIISEAEKDLHSWESSTVPIQTSAGNIPESTLLPAPAARRARESQALTSSEPGFDGTATSDSARDLRGSVSSPYTDGYEDQGDNGYAAATRHSAAYVPDIQERAEPVTVAQGLEEPVSGPARGTRGAPNTIAFIPGTRQRVGPDTETEGFGESSTRPVGDASRAGYNASDYNPGVLDNSTCIPGTKERIVLNSQADEVNELNEATDAAPSDVDEGIAGVGDAAESAASTRYATKDYDEPISDAGGIEETSQITEPTTDVNSMLAEARSAREKLQEQPYASSSVPQAVAVPY